MSNTVDSEAFARVRPPAKRDHLTPRRSVHADVNMVVVPERDVAGVAPAAFFGGAFDVPDASVPQANGCGAGPFQAPRQQESLNGQREDAVRVAPPGAGHGRALPGRCREPSC
jgi:hypothetical protein